jgi:methylphosphotriester-DNA--protein-cysteine methyltransferase
MMLDFAECDRERLARDPSYDGRFFTGVRTTGVYCRPVCPVRKPLSKNVSFFPLPLRPNTPDFGHAFAVGRRPRRSLQPGKAPARL